MKHAQPCPKCGARDRYVIEEARTPHPKFINAVRPLTLTAEYAETGESGLFGDKMDQIYVSVEARVCAGCAYTELYAKDLEVLERFAQEGLGGVRRERAK
jgi:predicted nucleic-acid-binding Zn-ribbon protein